MATKKATATAAKPPRRADLDPPESVVAPGAPVPIDAAAPAMARDERVRLAAYRRFLARGAAGGDEVADWLEAESEVALEDEAASALKPKPRARKTASTQSASTTRKK